MERLTRANISVDKDTDRYLNAKIGMKEFEWSTASDSVIDLILNGPVLMGFRNDVLRKIIRELYVRLKPYEDLGLEPWQADAAKYIVETAFEDKPERAERIRDLMRADKEGRVVVLPCKVGERWGDEDGRAVRITAVIVSMEPFGENINIYFDYEDATPDDAGSDCVTNWYHFSRIFTCAETVLDNRKDADNA